VIILSDLSQPEHVRFPGSGLSSGESEQFKRTTIVRVLLHCLLVCYLCAPRLASPRLQPPTELNSTTTISPPLRDQRQEMTLEPTPSADVVDSEPPLARSPSPSDRRIARNARPRAGYVRLPRTDSDIDSTSGRSIWNADSTADMHWQLWPDTDIEPGSRQFSLIRRLDTSVIQYGRCVGVKSCFSTPEALGDSGLPPGRHAAAPTMVRTPLAA